MDKKILYMYLSDYLKGFINGGLNHRELLELSFFVREYLKFVAISKGIDPKRPRFLPLVAKEPKRSSLRSAIDISVKLAEGGKPNKLFTAEKLNGYFHGLLLDFNKAIQGATEKKETK